MSDTLPDRCRSCRTPIKWIKTPSGKNMPVDLASRETRVAIVGDVGVTTTTYICHFVTCPNANRHRRAKP